MTSFKELLQDVMSRNNRVNIAWLWEEEKKVDTRYIVVMVVPLIKSLDIKMKI